MDISTPSKLLKFKKYLTLPEAAKHLTGVCDEEVTEADILEFALDGHLKLSVYFGCTVYGKSGYLEENQLPKEFLKEGYSAEQYAIVTKFMDEHLSKFHWVENEKPNVVRLYDDVFDLPMIGSEWFCIEQKWKKEHGSFPSKKHHGLDAILIEDCKGNVYALHEIFEEDNDLLSGYKPPLESEELLRHLSEQAQKNCYPAGGLPLNSSLLIRTESLRKFEQLITVNEPVRPESLHNNSDKSVLTESERRSMLKLIIGMAIDAYGYNPEDPRSKLTGDKNGLSAKLSTHGIDLDADTIRKHLKAAKNYL